MNPFVGSTAAFKRAGTADLSPIRPAPQPRRGDSGPKATEQFDQCGAASRSRQRPAT